MSCSESPAILLLLLTGAEPKILETFSKLAMRDAMAGINNTTKLSPESMAQLIRSMNSMNNLQGR